MTLKFTSRLFPVSNPLLCCFHDKMLQDLPTKAKVPIFDPHTPSIILSVILTEKKDEPHLPLALDLMWSTPNSLNHSCPTVQSQRTWFSRQDNVTALPSAWIHPNILSVLTAVAAHENKLLLQSLLHLNGTRPRNRNFPELPSQHQLRQNERNVHLPSGKPSGRLQKLFLYCAPSPKTCPLRPSHLRHPTLFLLCAIALLLHTATKSRKAAWAHLSPHIC